MINSNMIKIGARYGRLIVVRILRENCRTVAYCQCDCGRESRQMSFHLPKGSVISCGCARLEQQTKHGHSRTPEYKAWQSARRRCRNPDAPDYQRYGGRGIRMCAEWADDFEAFLAHAGPRPGAEYSLDRVDVNGDYAPGNVRWATRYEQGCNKTNSRILVVHGEPITLPEASRRWGVPIYGIRNRLRRGWPHDEAVGASPRTARSSLKTG